jgi:hypothetical protein
MKKSNKTPSIAASDYGQSLAGFSINLSTADLSA